MTVKRSNIFNMLVLLVLCLLFVTKMEAQTPNLQLEGMVTTNVILDDGFEDVSIAPFTTGGAAGWSVQSTTAYTGIYAAKSGTITDNDSTYIETTVVLTNDGEISFALKVSSENNFDKIYFSIDGVDQLVLSGNRTWKLFNFELSTGSHLLRWNYRKDGSASHNDDAVYLDSVLVKDVDGHIIQIVDGNQGIGKLLVSDESGRATWVPPLDVISKSAIPFILNADLPIDYANVYSGAPLVASNESNSGIGLRIPYARYGIRIDSCSGTGLVLNNLAYQGIVSNGGYYGITVNSAQYGLTVNSAQYTGVTISGGSGAIYASGQSLDGIYINNPGDDGVEVNHPNSNGTTKFAGYFNGHVYGTTISKGSGTFIIDHPLDPENKYLYHSFVESPDMMNVYNGNVLLDENGEAEVTMADWFEALNKEYRYQLTPIGAPGPNLYVATEIENLTFKIAGGVPGSKVSWQVTGIRQDAFADANRVQVEVDKPEEQKGLYLHDKAWEQKLQVSDLPGIDEMNQKEIERREAVREQEREGRDALGRYEKGNTEKKINQKTQN